MDMPHNYEIEDNTQLTLRNIIESYRILPYNLSFSELQPSMQRFLLKACKSYKPTCVSGDVNHSCIFRYFNNEKTSKILQPRYKCKTCKRLFTLFGQCYRRKRSSNDVEKCISSCSTRNCKESQFQSSSSVASNSNGNDDALSHHLLQQHMFMDNTHGNCPTACVSEGNYISLEDTDQYQQFSSEFFMSPAIQGDHAYADVVDPNEDGQHVSIDEIFEGAARNSTSPTAEDMLSQFSIMDTDQYQQLINSYSELDSMSLLQEPAMNSYCSNPVVNEGVSSTQGDSHENGVQENDKCEEDMQFSILISISHSSSVDGIDDFDIDDISKIDGHLDQTYFPNSIDNEGVSLLADWNSVDEFEFDQTLNLLNLR